ncbi:MAG: hypothetical protein SF172_11895 [Burkholderiales bacterium]|nr:hypothetical protein [Burkholderiales bacterium]
MNTQDALVRLAQGTLEAAARVELARRALTDPALARELKLALRLSAASAELARDWVAVAARAPAPAHSWWRPLAGVAASLAIMAAVLALPRQPGLEPQHSPSVALQNVSDRIGGASFEADSLSGGGFEAN